MGIASSAPSGPSTKPHTMRDRNDIVTLRPTASPTNFGWMTVWIRLLITR